MNYQLERGLKEGEDFMLVDQNIHKIWADFYGEDIPLKRMGIEDESGECIVELYFKRINILPVPNDKLFKLYKGKDVETQPIFISKTESVAILQKKIVRILMGYMMTVRKDRSFSTNNLRLWKANEDMKKLKELDDKHKNYTHAKIDAEIVNMTDDQKNKLLHEVNIADNDVMIVEFPRDGNFVFSPEKGVNDDIEFEDPMDVSDVKTNNVEEIAKLDLNQIFRKGSSKGLTGL